MQVSNLMKIIVSAIIGVVVFAAILIPVVGEATTTEKTFTNEGLYRMTEYDTTAEITAVWDYTDPNVMTVNNEEIELPQQSGSIYLMTVCGSDEMLVRYGDFGTGYGYGIQLFDSTTNSARITASVEQAKNLTITLSNGTATLTDGTTTVTSTYSDPVFVISTDGEYVMKKATDAAYLNGDSEFYGIGRSSVRLATGSTQACLVVSGTIDDGFTASGMVYTFTTANEVIVKTTVSDYIDLYSFTGVTFDLVYTYEETDYTSSQSYSQVIVPYEVTAELSVHPGTSEIALINIIPMLVLVGLVLGVVGAVIARRD